VTGTGFVGADPAGLQGLADVSEQYAYRVRGVGNEVARVLGRRQVAVTSQGRSLPAIEQAVLDMADELRWRAVAIADAQSVPVGSSWCSRWFLRSRAAFAARGVFETGRRPELDVSRHPRPSDAELGAMTPAEVSLAFESMLPPVAIALAQGSPDLVGGLNGTPPEVRYLANRLLIETEIARMQTQIAEMQTQPAGGPPRWFDPDHRIGLFQVSSLTDAMIAHFENQIGEYRRWLQEDRQILLFDPVGDGRVVEVFGDLASASPIAVVVPGAGNQLTSFSQGEGGFRQNAADLFAAASDLGGAGVATIAWLGYDPPDGIDATLKSAARDGAASLGLFLQGIDPQSDSSITVVAHSYGSVLAGLAAGSGIEADNLVFIGSPGTTLDHADNANLRPGGRVWAALARNDPIGVAVSPSELPAAWVPPSVAPAWFMFDLVDDGAEELWHGTGPTTDGFGALQITTDGSSGHSDYFEAGSLTNLARIVQGLYAEVDLVD
jgi:hypothetical protein